MRSDEFARSTTSEGFTAGASITRRPSDAPPQANSSMSTMGALALAAQRFLHTPSAVTLSRTPSPGEPHLGLGSPNAADRRKSRAAPLEGSRRRNSGSYETTPPVTVAGGDQHRGGDDRDEAQRVVLREMFNSIDTRGRGWISTAATRRLLSSFGVTLDNSDMVELMREVSYPDGTTRGMSFACQSPRLAVTSEDATTTTALSAFDDAKPCDDDDNDDEEDDDCNGEGDDAYGVSCDGGDGGGGATPPIASSHLHPQTGTSLDNLPYRQRNRERATEEGLFTLVQKMFSGTSRTTSATKTVSKRSSVELEEDGVRIVAVGPSAQVDQHDALEPEHSGVAMGENHFHADVSNSLATVGPPPQQGADTPHPRRSSSNSLGGVGVVANPGRRHTTAGRAAPATMGAAANHSNSNSNSNHVSAGATKQFRRVSFEMFYRMVRVWQSAARFRQFEERSATTKHHLDNALHTRHFLPDATFMFFWELLMLTFATLTVFASLSVHTYQEKHLPRYLSMAAPLEMFVTLLFAVDMYVRFHTVQLTKTVSGAVVVVDAPQQLAKMYLGSAWFWVDLFACIPFRFLFFTVGQFDYILQVDPATGAINGGSGCVGCDDIDALRKNLILAKLFINLRVVKYLSHMTYFRESRLVLMTQGYISRYFVFVQGFGMACNMIVLMQIFATIYLSFAPRTDAEALHGGGLVLARAYYLVLTCFSSCGFGDIVPTSVNEQYYYIALVVVSLLVNGYVIGESVSFFQRSDIESRKSESLLELVAMCEYFCIPEGLQNEIVAFYSHATSSDIMNSYGNMFSTIPLELLKGLQLSSRLRLIRQLPYFDDLHRSARLVLCSYLDKATYCPEEYVIYAGEVGNEMFFLNHGFVDIFGPAGLYLVTLRHGNYFGEMAIIDPEPLKRTADVKAITYCEIYVLSKENFQDLLGKFPRLKSAVKTLAEKRRCQTIAAAANAAPILSRRSSSLKCEELEKRPPSANPQRGSGAEEQDQRPVADGSANDDEIAAQKQQSHARMRSIARKKPPQLLVSAAGPAASTAAADQPAVTSDLQVEEYTTSPPDKTMLLSAAPAPQPQPRRTGVRSPSPFHETTADNTSTQPPLFLATPRGGGATGKASIFTHSGGAATTSDGTGGASATMMRKRSTSLGRPSPNARGGSSANNTANDLFVHQSVLEDDDDLLQTVSNGANGADDNDKDIGALIETLEREMALLTQSIAGQLGQAQ